jgi:hypothetical protein
MICKGDRITVTTITLTYCSTQQDAHREDSTRMIAKLISVIELGELSINGQHVHFMSHGHLKLFAINIKIGNHSA